MNISQALVGRTSPKLENEHLVPSGGGWRWPHLIFWIWFIFEGVRSQHDEPNGWKPRYQNKDNYPLLTAINMDNGMGMVCVKQDRCNRPFYTTPTDTWTCLTTSFQYSWPRVIQNPNLLYSLINVRVEQCYLGFPLEMVPFHPAPGSLILIVTHPSPVQVKVWKDEMPKPRKAQKWAIKRGLDNKPREADMFGWVMPVWDGLYIYGI